MYMFIHIYVYNHFLNRTYNHTIYQIMGLDLAEQTASLGDCALPINSLTWREIVRIVLVSTAAKEVNISESDISATIKGM
jgi:hypothetical protein